jgi:hypothetical protein
LFLGKIVGNADVDLDEHVTPSPPPESLQTFAAQREDRPRLSTPGDFDFLESTLDERYIDVGTESRLRHPELDADNQIVAISNETIVRFNAYLHIQIPATRSPRTGLTLSGQSQPGALRHSPRNLDTH